MTTRGLVFGLVGAWLAAATLSTLAFRAAVAFGTMSFKSSAPLSAWDVIVMQASPWVGLAVLTPTVVALTIRTPLSRAHWRGALVLHGLTLPLFLVAHVAMQNVVSALLRWDWTRVVPSLDNVLARLPTSAVPIVIEYGLIVGVVEAWRSRSQARDRAVQAAALAQRSLALERDLAAARLQALRRQLQPHFLFNALNAVTALIEDRPVAARALVARLGQLLRLSLDRDDAVEVTLGDELDFTDHYLHVEQARFGEALVVTHRVEEETLGARIPGFLLQPLVENAVTHGFARLPSGGAIEVGAARSGEQLHLWVRNDALPSSALTEGVGLTQTRARLRELYGEAARMAVTADGHGFGVDIFLPWRVAHRLEDHA